MLNLVDEKISFVYFDEDILIIRKKSGIPCAPLKENEKNNALNLVSEKFPQVLTVNNLYKKIEGGLIHRIDTDTDGLVLFALNDSSWLNLYNQQKSDKFIKEYVAFCNKNTENKSELLGFPVFNFVNFSQNISNFSIYSKFRFYGPKGSQVRPVLIDEKSFAQKKAYDKIYTTKILEIKKENSIYKIKCKITSGFKHQVRCHLAWCGFPIVNDKIYNKNANKNLPMKFYASKLEFYHPTTNQLINFSIEI